MQWTDVAREFVELDVLAEIHICDTSLADWQSVFDAMRSSPLGLHYSDAGGPKPLPSKAVAAFLDEAHGNLGGHLEVTVAGVSIRCNFFDADSIEFDLDPSEVTGQAALDGVLGFLRLIADACGKPAVLTPEGAPKWVIFKAHPYTGTIDYRGG